MATILTLINFIFGLYSEKFFFFGLMYSGTSLHLTVSNLTITNALQYNVPFAFLNEVSEAKVAAKLWYTYLSPKIMNQVQL